MGMAVTMYNQQNAELIELAVKSSDPTHRITAAWAITFATISHQDGIRSIKSFVAHHNAFFNRTYKNNSNPDPKMVKAYHRLHTISQLKNHKPVEEINGCIYNLLADNDPLVVLAAREGCKQIAKSLFGDSQVDFGPSYDGQGESSRKDAVDMWQSYFEKSMKDKKEIVREAPVVKKRRRSPQEILGIDE
jgi:hypothetical protein